MSAVDCVPLFPAEQVPAILNILLDHAQTLRKSSETEHEDDLSDRLMKRLRLDPWIRSSPFTPIREFRVYDGPVDKAGHSGRIDICFMCMGGDQTYFAIEAKNLHVTYASGWKSKVSDYVTSDQGMMCFVASKYSAAQQMGAMLGYVFDGDIDQARISIARAIETNRLALKVEGENGLVRSDIVKRAERVDESHHRFDLRPFSIYHLLVPV